MIKKSACLRAAWCATQTAGKSHQKNNNKLHCTIFILHTFCMYVCLFVGFRNVLASKAHLCKKTKTVKHTDAHRSIQNMHSIH